MKLLKICILSLGVLFSTANCKVKFNGDGEFVVDEERVVDLSGLSDSIEYSHGGWYPAPDTPNFDLYLVLTRSGDKVQGLAHTPKCKVSGGVSLQNFQELNQLIKSAKTTISDQGMIDGGDEYVKLKKSDSEQKIFVSTGDSSYKKPVMLSEDANRVRVKVDSIADKILQNCNGNSRDLPTMVWLKENVSDQAVADQLVAQSMVRPYELTVQDIRIQFTTTGTNISGYKMISGYNQQCITKINTTISGDSDWRNAAQSIKFEKRGEICQRALGVFPGDEWLYNLRYPKNLSLYFANDKVEKGFFGCENSSQVLFSETLLKLLDSALKDQKTECVVGIN
jgi:predicted transcriptional regulator